MKRTVADNVSPTRKSNFVKLVLLVIFVGVLSVTAAESVYAQMIKDASSCHVSPMEGKTTVGVIENVILNPWGISFPARIDTGADLSSLDARKIVVRNNLARFRLGKRYGGVQIQLPVLEWRQIRTTTGTEERPVVEISICLASKVFRTPATLADRSEMVYPFLVGRSALTGTFLVDPNRSRAAQPGCPSATLAEHQVLFQLND